MAVLLVAGCTSQTPSYSSEPTKQGSDVQNTPAEPEATVQTIGQIYAMAKNWDADQPVDGLEVTLNPEDRDGKPVHAEGTATAKLTEQIIDYNTYGDFAAHDGNVLGTWSNVKVTKDNYDFMGATVRFNYDDIKYVPGDPGLTGKTGKLELTFTTPDGKSFQASESSIVLNGYS